MNVKLKAVSPRAQSRTSGPPSPVSVLLGKQLLDGGKLTDSDVLRVIAAQRENHLRFGEAAVSLGLLSEIDVQEALARQHRYPYVLQADSELSPELYAANQPFGARSEALRTLRAQLMLRWFGDQSKCLAVVSSREGEGASTTAANLAIAFAQLSERTLLIDANLRNPAQHRLFGQQAAAGLSNLLTGRCELDDVIIPIAPFERLSLLCAGAAPPNPQELLSSVSFSYLVETAPSWFDIIIIDTPPILDCADAQVVAGLAGACLLVTHQHQTRLADVEQVKQLLVPTGAELVGTVLCVS
jgi:chain length determinant protein tyrosine kinase EpsG